MFLCSHFSLTFWLHAISLYPFYPPGNFLVCVFISDCSLSCHSFFFFLAVLFSSCACVLLAHLSALQCLSAAFLPSVDGLNLSHSCNCPSPLWHSWRCEYAAVSNPAFPLSFASLLYQVENPAGFCNWPANIAFFTPPCMSFCLLLRYVVDSVLIWLVLLFSIFISSSHARLKKKLFAVSLGSFAPEKRNILASRECDTRHVFAMWLVLAVVLSIYSSLSCLNLKPRTADKLLYILVN